MKKNIILILMAMMLSMTVSVFAETLKIAYIDSDKIMAQSKDTVEARKKFETDQKAWQQQIKDLDDEIQRLKNEYDSRKMTMTDELKSETEKTIQAKIDARQKFVKDIFGENGKAAQRNAELLSPILKKIQTALEKISVDQNLAMVFDGSSGGILYAKPSLDITDQVIAEINKVSE